MITYREEILTNGEKYLIPISCDYCNSAGGCEKCRPNSFKTQTINLPDEDDEPIINKPCKNCGVPYMYESKRCKDHTP